MLSFTKIKPLQKFSNLQYKICSGHNFLMPRTVGTRTNDSVFCSEQLNCLICLYFDDYEDGFEPHQRHCIVSVSETH